MIDELNLSSSVQSMPHQAFRPRTIGLLLLLSIFLISCANGNNEKKKPVPDSMIKRNPTASIDTTIFSNDRSIWVYDFEKEIPVRARTVDPDTLTSKKLIDLMNGAYPDIHLDFVKVAHDTIFVRIKNSTYLTQSIGPAGADGYMSETTFTLTELKGIKYVNFDFEEGDHAVPGTFSRRDYLERR